METIGLGIFEFRLTTTAIGLLFLDDSSNQVLPFLAMEGKFCICVFV